jgi:mRNA interferase YafQ
MKQIVQTRRFAKDFKRIRKRGYDLGKLAVIIDLLAEGKPLPEKAKPHRLVGSYQGFWECHIEPDWLIVYDYDDAFLELVATGTHSDLFR